MPKQTKNAQTDIRAAVDAISSHFSADAGSAQDGTSAHVGKHDDHTNAEEPPAGGLDAYLAFSDTHRGSNHIMLGVVTFFVLVAGVWGFLWYQTLINMNITDSFDYSVLSDNTDEISALFEDITAASDAASALDAELVLKADLASALSKEYGASAVLGTTTTDTATTPTITE